MNRCTAYLTAKKEENQRMIMLTGTETIETEDRVNRIRRIRKSLIARAVRFWFNRMRSIWV